MMKKKRNTKQQSTSFLLQSLALNKFALLHIKSLTARRIRALAHTSLQSKAQNAVFVRAMHTHIANISDNNNNGDHGDDDDDDDDVATLLWLATEWLALIECAIAFDWHRIFGQCTLESLSVGSFGCIWLIVCVLLCAEEWFIILFLLFLFKKKHKSFCCCCVCNFY